MSYQITQETCEGLGHRVRVTGVGLEDLAQAMASDMDGKPLVDRIQFYGATFHVTKEGKEVKYLFSRRIQDPQSIGSAGLTNPDFRSGYSIREIITEDRPWWLECCLLRPEKN